MGQSNHQLIIILVLPPGVVCSSNRALPMLGTADGDAVSHCQVMGRACSVHHGADHGSRCCMVCLMPQSHISCSLENPHFNIFSLDRPTCVRNRLSAFQVVQGLYAPAGRCSPGLMLRCTLASRGSSSSLHSSMRAAFGVVLMGSVHLMKLFLYFRRGTTPRCTLSGCLWSVVFRLRSVRLATALLMSGAWGDSGEYGQTDGICRLQTACDHSTGFIQCHIQFLCMGGELPHRAGVLCS